MISDEELMQAMADGDLDAFQQIILRHQQTAWSLASRFIGDSAAAHDIVQEAFLKILESAPRYRPIAKFRTYLYHILTRICIDYSRKKKPILVDFIPDIVSCSPAPLNELIVEEREAEVRKTLDALPPNQKSAIILKYFESLSYSEISRILQITPKAVERLISRARRTLKARLSHLEEF